MSALLDALKKAADEKKGIKNSSTITDEVLGLKEVTNDIATSENFVKKQNVDENKSEELDQVESDQVIARFFQNQKNFELETKTPDDHLLEQEQLKDIKAIEQINSDVGIVNQLFEDENAVEDEKWLNIIKDDSSEKKESHSELSLKDEDSEWSLSQIPGYQQYDSNEQKKKETKEILGVLSSQKKKQNGKKIKIIAYTGLSILFLFGISIYSIYYYQLMSQDIENDLKKYQLNEIATIESANVLDSSAKVIVNAASNKQKVQENSLYKNVDKSVISDTTIKESTPIEQKNIPIKLVSKKIIPTKKTNKIYLNPPARNRKVFIKKEDQNRKDKLAFLAYKKGDYKKAENIYNESLIENPSNIFALSGLGSIAIKRGEFLTASKFYKNILNIEPSNKKVNRALLSLKSLVDSKPELKEEIEELIYKNPTDPALKFSLGNYYAKRSDWAAAQKQYFAASSMSLDNQIYALNLAISLDKLARYEKALSFYKKAISLAKIQGSSFDTNSVKKRIIALSDFNKGTN